jgi:hypothetical protein
MLQVSEHPHHCRALDDPAVLHYRDPIACLRRDPQIMGDE